MKSQKAFKHKPSLPQRADSNGITRRYNFVERKRIFTYAMVYFLVSKYFA